MNKERIEIRRRNYAPLFSLLLLPLLAACEKGSSFSENSSLSSEEISSSPAGETSSSVPTSDFFDQSDMSIEEALERDGYDVIDRDQSHSYSLGDKVYFGSYPQALVTDSSLLKQLSALAGNPPNESENNGWTSYGYYSEGQVSDYFFWKDLTLENKKYRGVYRTAYRPATFEEKASDESTGHGDGQPLDAVSWYAYSPLEWTLLSYGEHVAYLDCFDIIDCQPFEDRFNSSYQDPDSLAALHDWSASSLRTFLNGAFLDAAFSPLQKSLISLSDLNNSATAYKTAYGSGLSDTRDSVFLPSFKDLMNQDYGFPETKEFHLQGKYGVDHLNDLSIEEVVESMSRRRGITDYDLIQGLNYSVTCLSSKETYTAVYSLRSAGENAQSIAYVSKYGDLIGSSTSGTAAYDLMGVVPALRLHLGK